MLNLYNFDSDVDHPKPIQSPRSQLAMKRTGVTAEMIQKIPFAEFKAGRVLPGWVRDSNSCEEWQLEMKYQAMEEKVRLRSLEKARHEYQRICNGEIPASQLDASFNASLNTSAGTLVHDEGADQSRLLEIEKKRLAKFEKKMADEIKQKVQFQMQTKASEEKNAAKQARLQEKEMQRQRDLDRKRMMDAENARRREQEKADRAAHEEARKQQELADKEAREREFALRKQEEERIRKEEFRRETERKHAKKEARRRDAEEKMHQERLANEQRQQDMQRKEAQLADQRARKQREQKMASERKREAQERRAAASKAEGERKLEADKERFLANELKVQQRLDRFEHEKEMKKIENRERAEHKREDIQAAVHRMEMHEEEKRNRQLAKDRALEERMRHLSHEKMLEAQRLKRLSLERRDHIEHAIAKAHAKEEARKQDILRQDQQKQIALTHATNRKNLEIVQMKTNHTIAANVNTVNVHRVKAQQEFWREGIQAQIAMKEQRVNDLMDQKNSLYQNRLRMQRNMAQQKNEIDEVMDRLRKGKFIDRSNMPDHIKVILASADAAAKAAASGGASGTSSGGMRRAQSAGGLSMAKGKDAPSSSSSAGMSRGRQSTQSVASLPKPGGGSRPPRAQMKYASDNGFSARSIVEQYAPQESATLTPEQNQRLCAVTDEAERTRLKNIFNAQNSR